MEHINKAWAWVKANKKISIIACFRNEEETINKFINRVNNSFKRFNHIDYELIFVDDFSNDLSNVLIKKACINIGFFQVTGHGINKKNIKNISNVGQRFFNSSKNDQFT